MKGNDCIPSNDKHIASFDGLQESNSGAGLDSHGRYRQSGEDISSNVDVVPVCSVFVF